MEEKAIMRFVALSILLASVLIAGPITPLSYTATPGQSTYLDETGRQLIDTVVGCSSDWSADCGEGVAYRWVGWETVSPVVTFDFGAPYSFSKLSIHSNHWVLGSVLFWDDALVQFSNDGATFGAPVIRTTVASPERNDPTARFLDVNLNHSGRYVRLTLSDGPAPGLDDPTQWIFISEVAFDGAAATPGNPVPEPGTLVMIGAGLASVAFLRRRRSRRGVV